MAQRQAAEQEREREQASTREFMLSVFFVHFGNVARRWPTESGRSQAEPTVMFREQRVIALRLTADDDDDNRRLVGGWFDWMKGLGLDVRKSTCAYRAARIRLADSDVDVSDSQGPTRRRIDTKTKAHCRAESCRTERSGESERERE